MIDRYFNNAREEADFIFDNYNSYTVMKLIHGTGEGALNHSAFMPLYSLIRACSLIEGTLYIGDNKIEDKTFFTALKQLRSFVVASFDKTDCSWIPLLGDENDYRVVMRNSNGELYYVSTYQGNIPFTRNLDDGIGPKESFLTDDSGDKIKGDDGKYITI